MNPTGELPEILDYRGVGKITYGQPEEGKNNGADCTGVLLPSGRHVLTAAHCFDPQLISTGGGGFEFPRTSYFQFFHSQTNLQPHVVLPFEERNTSDNDTFVHPLYIRNNTALAGYDIAIVDLDVEVDAAIPRYDIYRGANEFTLNDVTTGSMRIVGYGESGSGGSNGECKTRNPGFRREGTNRFEGYGEMFNGMFQIPPGYIGPPQTQLAFDFDSGLAANDAMQFYFPDPVGVTFHNDPIGTTEEAAYGANDSGGPNFIGDRIAGITSWGIFDDDLSNVNVVTDRRSQI